MTQTSTITLVDLAGFERQVRTSSTGKVLREGSAINNNLIALANVINKLVDAQQQRAAINNGEGGGQGGSSGGPSKGVPGKKGKPPPKIHVPFRSSRLTRILKQSLGGNALTCILLTIKACRVDVRDSTATLNFGLTCQKLRSSAQVRIRGSIKLSCLLVPHK